MATKKAAEEQQVVKVQQPRLERMLVPIIGETPLVTHRISEAAKTLMVAKALGQEIDKNKVRVLEDEFEAALYRTKEGLPAFPARGVKRALVAAARCTSETMVMVNQIIQVKADLIVIEGSKPDVKIDTPRQKSGELAVSFRAVFEPWRMEVPVTYLRNIISKEQVLYLFQLAGAFVGLGCGRAECHGTNGSFKVEGL